jgi:hypothetical protein
MAHVGQPGLPESCIFLQNSNPGALCSLDTQVQNIVTAERAMVVLSTGPRDGNIDGLPMPSNPPTSQDWNLYQDVFTQLYSHEDLPLKEVRIIMEQRYKFYAS